MLSLSGCCSLEEKLLFYPVRSEKQLLPPNSPVQDVELQSANGVTINARWCPRPGSKGALLYCQGNAGNLESRAKPVRDLWEDVDESVLIFDYPGYGRSDGRPSEAGFYAAAEAAYDWLVQSQGLAPESIILYGESLGGGVAVELASRLPHRALVLVRTFTSVPDVAQDHCGWLPVRGLVTNRFDSLAKIALCKQPTFIASADSDRLVPFEHGQRLKEAAGAHTTFYTLSGYDHNDPLPREFYSELRRFLGKPEPHGEQ
jgi:fermentation-respiration switch protein FrsA (DUF1100 family)